LRFALELAVLGIWAQRYGWVLPRLLNGFCGDTVMVSGLASTPDEARGLWARGFRVCKIKIGSGDISTDVQRVAALDGAVHGGMRWRLDANGAYGPRMAAYALRCFGHWRVDYMEQMLPAGCWEEQRRLKRHARVALALDESVVTGDSIGVALSGAYADVLVLKPMFMGSLIECFRMGSKAKAMGLRVVVTHALDSGVGRFGAASVAVALGGDEAHGLLGVLGGRVAGLTEPWWCLRDRPSLGDG
jgi:L-alanine-DL-glutamate epimerase-like enolase superfamily enzyme